MSSELDLSPTLSFEPSGVRGTAVAVPVVSSGLILPYAMGSDEMVPDA